MTVTTNLLRKNLLLLTLRNRTLRNPSSFIRRSISTSNTTKIPNRKTALSLTFYSLTLFSLGYAYGQTHQQNPHPSSLPRSCSCSTPLPPPTLIPSLQSLIGKQHVITPSSSHEILPFTKGARLGQGDAAAVLCPGTLRETLQCLQLILKHDCVIIPQGANTGLTGGSVPRNLNRPQFILNTKRLANLWSIDDGHKVLCLAGAGIADASKMASRNERESHSILGSTFLNPTASAGIAFGSGGTQLRKGPAFTERGLFVKVKKDGKTLKLVNTLGIDGLEEDDEKAIEALDDADSDATWTSSQTSPHGTAPSSDTNYKTKVCDTNASSVARYNADVSGLELNRSEGKVFILATVHDTFVKPTRDKTYWVSFRDLDTALAFRKRVVLYNPNDLPISCEYMDRDSFDVVDRSGRIMAHVISYLGLMHDGIGTLWNVKLRIEALPLPFADVICDKVLHWFNYLFFPPLSTELMNMGKEMDHHLMITVGEYDEGCIERFEHRMEQFSQQQQQDENAIQTKECTPDETKQMTSFRFVAAPAFRTYCIGTNSRGISVDYALPRNSGIPPLLEENKPRKRMRYSHFGCNVVHEDLAFDPEVDVDREKMKLKKKVEVECGGKLPAEHGHGVEYCGPTETRRRWRRMDPSNVMNPGIGGLVGTKDYE